MKEALKLALEALEMHVPHVYKDRGYGPITAIKEALAQPEQEPVAYEWRLNGEVVNAFPLPPGDPDGYWAKKGYTRTTLYRDLPKRPWVGLTDAEMQALWDRYAHMEMMRAIEAKLKEKNT